MRSAVPDGLLPSEPYAETGRELPRRDGVKTEEEHTSLEPEEFALPARAMRPVVGTRLLAVGGGDHRLTVRRDSGGWRPLPVHSGWA